MATPRRILVVLTARASYCRIKTAMRAIQQHPDLELQVVAAGSAILPRYGSAERSIEADGFRIRERVFMLLEGENPATSAASTGIGVMALSSVFTNLAPDVVVTVADRFETLATAVAASYMNIPVAHVQGGEVTGSIDEKVRHAVTKLADIHLPSTPAAARRLVQMGENPASIVVTGCPSIDVAASIAEEPTLAFDPIVAYGGVGANLDIADGYLLVVQHPVTTECAESRRHVEETLHVIHELGTPTLWFWPNSDAGSDGTSNGIRAFRERFQPANIHFFKNMTPEDFLRLANHSRCLLGNSSVGIRECGFLGVPVVNVGGRQHGRERGPNVVDVPYERQAILDATRTQMAHGRFPRCHLYGDGSSGSRIAAALATMPLTTVKRFCDLPVVGVPEAGE